MNRKNTVFHRIRYGHTLYPIVAIPLLLMGNGCGPGKTSPEKVTIAWLKSLDIDRADKATRTREYILEGYFVNETVPLLVTEMHLLRQNRPMPETSYVLLKGKGIDSFAKRKDAFGTFVRLKGTIESEQQPGKTPTGITLYCPEPPDIVRAGGFVMETRSNICEKYPSLCATVFKLPRKFALLYSGGYNAANAHIRYWNDLKFMYLTLRSKYGYTDANIVVVYKDGVGEDTDIPVDYPASSTGMNDALNSLRSHMRGQDDFFVFVTNHGGGYHQVHAANEGGRADATPGDEIDSYRYDESTYYYNQSPNEVWDDDFASWINSLNFARMTAVFEPCFSAGFIHDLKGCNRILISAASEFEYSWGDGTVPYDVFSYHFTCAINKADDSGGTLTPNPDTDGDGYVSILEAFLYAKSKDTASETPYLEDSGDGVGSNSPTASGTDGSLSSTTRL